MKGRKPMHVDRRHAVTALVVAALAALALAAVAGAAGGRDTATGAGKAPDPNFPGTELSFVFAARNTSMTGVEANGVFILSHRAVNSELRGRVICLKVVGNRAVIAGEVVRARGPQPGEPVTRGDSFLAFTEDNGTGTRAGAVDNLSIFTFHDPAPTADLCNADESGP